MFVRPTVREKGLPRSGRAGDGLFMLPKVTNNAADSAQTIPVATILGGVYTRSGMTLARIDTTDTAVNILAAMPDMDIGDTYVFYIGNTSVATLTVAGGVGVTASGNLAVLTLTSKIFILTKTSATAMTLLGL